VTTADIVRERSLQLASSHHGSQDAVQELLKTSGGRRVSLVLAKQQLTELLEDDPPSEIVHRGLELITQALRETETEG
jgi:hypothetical protein